MSRIVSACAWTGLAGFVVLFASFGAPADSAFHLAGGYAAIVAHLVLLPVVAALPAPSWARTGGYAWLLMDSALNVMTINGAPGDVVTPMRLGLHVLASAWIVAASLAMGGPARVVGPLLALALGGYSLVAPWVPSWTFTLAIPLLLAWLGIVAWRLTRGARREGPRGVAA